MAGSPGPLGLVYFAGVKAIGYTAASVVLKRGYGLRSSPSPSVLTIGLTRTAIGIGAGLLYGGAWYLLVNNAKQDISPVYYFVFLLPIRLVEWSFLIWIFLDRGFDDRVRLLTYATFGTICSYVLDAIAVGAAFVLPGGIWVC